VAANQRKQVRLPARLRPHFWDYEFARLSWERDCDLVTARILAVGDWEDVQWLRDRLGDDALRTWLMNRQGAGLSPRQLRFWELLLGIPTRLVDGWLRSPGRQSWDRRRHP
jgi:hypothetical protein